LHIINKPPWEGFIKPVNDMRIENLKPGDTFKTKTGKRVYTIADIVYSRELDANVWLLKGGWYVVNPSKEVIKQD
jgi:hypothetical protein